MTAANVRRLLSMVATVTRREPGETADVFGDVVDQVLEVVTLPCWVAQAQRGEDTANTAQTTESWQCYLPVDAVGVVGPHDTLEVDGMVFEVDGPPWPVLSPRTGQRSHVVATLRRVV